MDREKKRKRKGQKWTKKKKRKTKEENVTGQNIKESYLRQIYFDPKHPGSFKGPQKLYQAIKEEGRHNIGLTEIKRWLKDSESFSLHKNLNRKFERLRVIVTGVHDQYDADLADMHKLSRRNDDVTFLLRRHRCIQPFPLG